MKDENGRAFTCVRRRPARTTYGPHTDKNTPHPGCTSFSIRAATPLEKLTS